MKRIFTISLFIAFAISEANAQFFIPDKAHVKEASQREILVLLENPAHQRNEWLNTHTQKFIKQLWKFTPNVTFKHEEEVAKLLANTPEKYATLSWYYAEKTFPGSHTIAEKGVFVLGLRLYNSKEEWLTVSEVAFPDDNITEYDIAFAVQHLQIDLEAGLYNLRKDDPAYWNDARLNEIVKGKTVLLNSADWENEIKNKTKIHFRKTDNQAITKAVVSRSENYFFITTIFSDKYFMPVKALISTQTMEPVLYFRQSSVGSKQLAVSSRK